MESNIPIEVIPKILCLYLDNDVLAPDPYEEGKTREGTFRGLGQESGGMLAEIQFVDDCGHHFEEPCYEPVDKVKLLLTPLSMISDEDLATIGFKFPNGKEGITVNFYPDSYDCHWRTYRYGHLLKDGYLSLKDFDFLRSRGYALPAYGYTVEQLVSAGIFQLKTNQ